VLELRDAFDRPEPAATDILALLDERERHR
jgi:hypothetical protein